MSTFTFIDRILGNDGKHEAEVRPEPVLDEARAKASVAAFVTAVATAAVALGVVTTSDAATLSAAVIAVGGGVVVLVNYVLTMRAAYAARAKVTPLSDPVDSDGEALVTHIDTAH